MHSTSATTPAPALEFVIAARDAADTIGQTLASLAAQTLPDWGAVVVDDGSVDGTADVAAGFGDGRVRVVRRAAEGVAAARNAGLAIAAAPVVAFLDADDFVAPGYVGAMLAGLGHFDAVACGHWYAGPDGARLDWTQAPVPGAFTRRGVLVGSPAPVGAIAVRRKALARLAGRAPYRDGAVEDWDLFLRFTMAGARWAPPLADPLFGYRLRPNSRFRRGEPVWRAGLELLRHAPASAAEVEAARRAWSLRRLAGAVAAGEQGLAATIEASLGGWGEGDLATLASAMATAFPFSECVGPREGATRAGEWLGRARALLGSREEWGRLEPMLDFDPARWDRLADAALARRPAGARLALYGMGRNGRALFEALRRAGARGVVCADDAGAPIDLGDAAVRLDDLRPGDFVIVTPNDSVAMVERVRSLGVGDVVALSDLTRPASALA